MEQIRQRNQSFGTLDLIILVVLCGTVSSVVGASIAGFWQDTRPGRARAAAENYALQLRQQHENAIQLNGTSGVSEGRSPASIDSSNSVPPLTDGQIGRDPWGRAYQYTVISGMGGSTEAVLVWSGGPNGTFDTDIGSVDESQLAGFKFSSDDIGFVYRSSQR